MFLMAKCTPRTLLFVTFIYTKGYLSTLDGHLLPLLNFLVFYYILDRKESQCWGRGGLGSTKNSSDFIENSLFDDGTFCLP
ncbi:hypothetical protein BpHYR1_020897 [Brachionus plicatilis]|uniref:Uncharacterized protein n=1 Tax=Brachionus plicatilis TaxID=10195 RepID=A0A3M7RW55_BRAPC|nr:hypothetical protein BpHYR1_020897 [Brachionus plicatilis]